MQFVRFGLNAEIPAGNNFFAGIFCAHGDFIPLIPGFLTQLLDINGVVFGSIQS